MTHPSEETLNEFVERGLSPADHVRVAAHVEICGECALLVAQLQHIVREAAALGPLTPPERVWSGIQARLDEQPHVRSSTRAQRGIAWRFAWAIGTAALVVAAFFVGRFAHRGEQRAPDAGTVGEAHQAFENPSIVRERVLLIAVGDHLERSQMVLVELAHAQTRDELDISSERQRADDLVASNRLYRQTARQMGQVGVADVLDELERVLVEVARGPSRVSMRQLANIQQRIESQGILFKVKIIGSEIRNQPVS
jgi:hypothetical protein